MKTGSAKAAVECRCGHAFRVRPAKPVEAALDDVEVVEDDEENPPTPSRRREREQKARRGRNKRLSRVKEALASGMGNLLRYALIALAIVVVAAMALPNIAAIVRGVSAQVSTSKETQLAVAERLVENLEENLRILSEIHDAGTAERKLKSLQANFERRLILMRRLKELDAEPPPPQHMQPLAEIKRKVGDLMARYAAEHQRLAGVGEINHVLGPVMQEQAARVQAL
jgi:hypothetical protein